MILSVMTDLSPAAQAVLDAVASQLEGGWISPEFIPYEARKIAAALRALVQHEGESVYTYDEDKFSVVRVVREDRILAIAAELEADR